MNKLLAEREVKAGVQLLLIQEKSDRFVIWQKTAGTLFEDLNWVVISPTLEMANYYLEVYSK